MPRRRRNKSSRNVRRDQNDDRARDQVTERIDALPDDITVDDVPEVVIIPTEAAGPSTIFDSAELSDSEITTPKSSKLLVTSPLKSKAPSPSKAPATTSTKQLNTTEKTKKTIVKPQRSAMVSGVDNGNYTQREHSANHVQCSSGNSSAPQEEMDKTTDNQQQQVQLEDEDTALAGLETFLERAMSRVMSSAPLHVLLELRKVVSQYIEQLEVLQRRRRNHSSLRFNTQKLFERLEPLIEDHGDLVDQLAQLRLCACNTEVTR